MFNIPITKETMLNILISLIVSTGLFAYTLIEGLNEKTNILVPTAVIFVAYTALRHDKEKNA